MTTPMTDEPSVAGGWSTSRLEHLLQVALLRGAAGWQLVVLAAAVQTTAGPTEVRLVALHLALAGAFALAAVDRLESWVPSVALAAVVLIDWSAAPSTNSSLSLAATWLCHLGQLLVVVVLAGRASVVGTVAVGYLVPLGIVALQPDRARALALPVLVVGITFRLAARLARPVIRTYSDLVDEEAGRARTERRRAAEAQAADREAAEQSRLLHDTAINTLAAVASGGGAVRDVALVRDRAGRDAEVLRRMLAGRTERPRLAEGWNRAALGLEVRRTGLDDEALAELGAGLPEGTVRALDGAVAEALRNVAKHAGTGQAELRAVRRANALVIIVTDRGVGFDGAPVPGRGLAESVVARCREADVAVAVHSRPGAGTEVRLTCPLDATAPSAVGPDDGFRTSARVLSDRASWAYAGAIVVVGLAIDLFGRAGHVGWTYGMLVVATAVLAVARRDRRRHGRLRAPARWCLAAAVPAVYLLALAGVDFGRDEIVHWHSLGVTAPLVLLLVQTDLGPAFRVGFGALVATAAGVTLALAGAHPEAAALVPVGTGAALGVTVGWAYFHRTLARLAADADAEHLVASHAAVERAARRAAAEARGRWRAVGLAGALELLDRLATGQADPGDAAVRAACAAEEARLRQVHLLDPALFRLGTWFARALSEAHDRGVALVVRTGDQEVEDDATAEALGSLLGSVVAAVAPGHDVTASLFRSEGRLRFAIVGPAPFVGTALAGWAAPSGWTAAVQPHGAVELLEVTRPMAARTQAPTDVAAG